MILLSKFQFSFYLLLLTVVLFSVSSSYGEDKLEARKESVRRKQPNHSKRNTVKHESSTSKLETSTVIEENRNEEKEKNEEPTSSASNKIDETVPVESSMKKVNKRQQNTQAKPILEPNRRVDSKKRVESCPLCDSSVFSYCSDKLLHDACCCLNPFENNLPYQCQYADCSFLHANSCREHHLITSCCCDRFIYRL